MKRVRVCLAQVAPKLGDVQGNLEAHLEVAERARRDGADWVVFPELSLTGYVLWDQVPDVALRPDDATYRRLAEAAREIDLIVGLVEEAPGHRYHNAAVHFSGGRVLHTHRKVYLTNYGMFEEARDFAAGERLRGYDTGFGPCGLLICEDLWHPSSAWLLALQGAEVLVVLSNGPTRGARPDLKLSSNTVWRELVQVTARFQTVYVVYVNRVGCEDGLTFGGGSLVVDPLGRTQVELPALAEDRVTVDLDPEVLRRARTATPLLRDDDVELASRELERIRARRYDLGGPVEEEGAS